MSSSGLKIVAAVLVLLAIVLGAVTVSVFRQNEERAQKAAAREAEQKSAVQTLAVVAAKPIAAYQAIDRTALALVPVAVAPANYYTNIDEVVGKIPLIDIDTGAPVTPRYFKEGNLLAQAIPAGYEAVSVEINDVVAVGGFLKPGDIVDVLLFLRNGAGVDQPMSRVLLPQARLLAYEERIIDRPEGLKEGENAERQQRRIRTAVLAVPQAETTKVMLGASLGELRLALHSQGRDSAAQPEDGKEARRSDKVVTVAELTRLTATQPAVSGQAAPPPPPSVEIYRGSQRERVTTRN